MSVTAPTSIFPFFIPIVLFWTPSDAPAGMQHPLSVIMVSKLDSKLQASNNPLQALATSCRFDVIIKIRLNNTPA
jgi:hypothetical protein